MFTWLKLLRDFGSLFSYPKTRYRIRPVSSNTFYVERTYGGSYWRYLNAFNTMEKAEAEVKRHLRIDKELEKARKARENFQKENPPVYFS